MALEMEKFLLDQMRGVYFGLAVSDSGCLHLVCVGRRNTNIQLCVLAALS